MDRKEIPRLRKCHSVAGFAEKKRASLRRKDKDHFGPRVKGKAADTEGRRFETQIAAETKAKRRLANRKAGRRRNGPLARESEEEEEEEEIGLTVVAAAAKTERRRNLIRTGENSILLKVRIHDMSCFDVRFFPPEVSKS